MSRTCDLAECADPHYGLGYCSKHYNRVRRTGSPHLIRIGHRYEPVDIGDRLFASVERQGDCLVFTGGRPSRSGHRLIWRAGKFVGAHRAAWELTNGAVPDGLCVLHSCDNPPCINEAHLSVGTVADNNRQRDERGRHVALRGSRNGFASLDEWRVAEIKRSLLLGFSTYALAKKYEVHQATVWQIKDGRTWSHADAAIEGPISRAEMFRQIRNSGPCVYCGAGSRHVDHLFPLALGGNDSESNLVPACAKCNNGKSAKLLSEWDQGRVSHAAAIEPKVAAELVRQSLWLAAMAADHYGHPAVAMPQANRVALDAVTWPGLGVLAGIGGA